MPMLWQLKQRGLLHASVQLVPGQRRHAGYPLQAMLKIAAERGRAALVRDDVVPFPPAAPSADRRRDGHGGDGLLVAILVGALRDVGALE